MVSLQVKNKDDELIDLIANFRVILELSVPPEIDRIRRIVIKAMHKE